MNQSLKVLILEDILEDVGLIERELKKAGMTFTVMQVDTREEFEDAIKHFVPDVILSDHSLPQFNSIEALKIHKAQDRDIPFILVTGTVSEEFAVNCLKLGADDYVLKSNLARLPSAILTSIRRHSLEHEKHIAEQNLLEQNAELVKINKELDSFVYNVSHNLRSPLASVLGLLHLIKKEKSDINSLQHYFIMMEHSVKKLDGTLKEILDYSQNNRNEVYSNRIDFKRLINNCFLQIVHLEGQQEIEKIITVEGSPFFNSDSHRLSVLFHNLISNSVKYRDQNKTNQLIQISITISHAQAIIRFEDNGIGIADEQLPHVFEMFYRATEQSDGAGLGLYIAQEIVHVLKGDMTIQSKIHKGTALQITIPNLNLAH